MWLIPRTSRFSRFAPATAGLNSDYPLHWKTLLESLEWRSKHTRWRTWLQRLRKISWLSKLCGRICEPSRQQSFEDALISSLRGIRVSRSALPGKEKARSIPDTFGRILDESLRQLSLFGASSRTCRVTSLLGSTEFTQSYETWVTLLRQDCLRRRSAVRRTNGKDCLSWPTADMMMGHRVGKELEPENWQRQQREKARKGINKQFHLNIAVNWPTPNVPNRGCESDKSHRPESGGIDLQSTVNLWSTPQARDGKGADLPSRLGKPGLPDQVSASTNGKNPALWMTPEAKNQEGYQVAGSRRYDRLGTQANSQQPYSGKLNPRWVEQLMGLLVGWTDLGSWATG